MIRILIFTTSYILMHYNALLIKDILLFTSGHILMHYH
jgi:hypothetical protein